MSSSHSNHHPSQQLDPNTYPDSIPLIPAATVLLVRPTETGDASGMDVFMQHRVASMVFASGVWVFPGGGVDPSDYEITDDRITPDGSRKWAEGFAISTELSRALVSAVVREVWEETSVVLGDHAPSNPGALRQDLSDHRVSLQHALTEVGTRIAGANLAPWARWITPLNMPKRYDTFFFLAQLPAGQHPDAATSEARTAKWWGVEEALQAWDTKDMPMLHPTWYQLKDLRSCATMQQALSRSISADTVFPLRIMEGESELSDAPLAHEFYAHARANGSFR